MPYLNFYQISVDRTKCGTSNLTSYPITVFLSNANFKDQANGGLVKNNTTGYDIVFATDQLGANLIPWEIEFYDNVNGIIWAHVALSINGSAAGSNTSFYVCFNNSSISTAQNTGSFASTAVWDSNYKSVWHLGNGTTLASPTLDSTSNVNSGTLVNTPTATTGKIDGGANFSQASNQYITAAAVHASSGKLTIEFWAKPTLSGTDLAMVGMWTSGAGTNNEWLVLAGSDVGTTRQIGFWAQQTDTTIKQVNVGSYTDGVLLHIVALADGTNLSVYINGALSGSALAYNGTLNTSSSAITNIGALGPHPAGYSMNGVLDEIRISNINRSTDYILTAYNNQNAPGNIGSNNFLIFSSLGTNSTLNQGLLMLGCGS